MDTQQAHPPGTTRPVMSALATPEIVKSNWKFKAVLIGGGLLLIAIMVAIVYLLTRNPALTANLRDIAIIAFALVGLIMSIVIGALLIVMIYYLQSLLSILRNEIRPLLANVQQTVNTVRGTTSLVSENVAKPVIKVASFLAGLEGAHAAFRKKTDKSNKN